MAKLEHSCVDTGKRGRKILSPTLGSLSGADGTLGSLSGADGTLGSLTGADGATGGHEPMGNYFEGLPPSTHP